jgi:hypothetical protein
MKQNKDGSFRAPGADPSSDELQALGKRFVSVLYKNLKLTQIFDRRNKAIIQPLEELLRVSADLAAFDSGWELKLSKDHLHLSDVRLKIEVELFMSYHHVMDEFKKRGLGSLSFRPTAAVADLLDFLYAFRDAGKIPPADKPFEHLVARLARPEPAPIFVAPLGEDVFSRQPTSQDVRQRSITTFFKAVYLTRGILSAVDSQRVVHIRRAKRLVTSLVDILNIDGSTLLGMTNIKNFDEYTFNQKKLINIKGLSGATAKLMISVFRHHNNVDGSGYPPLRENEDLSLCSRIIRIVDSYDAMTSRRIYRSDHRNNVEAIEELWSLTGRHYDPAILKVFIRTVGIFPVGSLVQLNSGEIAIVLKNSSHDEHLLSPLVRTLTTWEKRPHTAHTIDLSTDTEKKIYGYFQGSEAEATLPTLLL